MLLHEWVTVGEVDGAVVRVALTGHRIHCSSAWAYPPSATTTNRSQRYYWERRQHVTPAQAAVVLC